MLCLFFSNNISEECFDVNIKSNKIMFMTCPYNLETKKVRVIAICWNKYIFVEFERILTIISMI